MPIVTSRSDEIRRLLKDLNDPRRREGAVVRLRSLGNRVVPHALDELGGLDPEARRALIEVLERVPTADARALRRRLDRTGPDATESRQTHGGRARPRLSSDREVSNAESMALEEFQRLPPPRRSESAAVSRNRGEAHLVLARLGSRLARRDLLHGLATLEANRARLYCEAAGLIGDLEFLAPLSRLAPHVKEASPAIAAIAKRENITIRSRLLRDLDASVRAAVAQSLL